MSGTFDTYLTNGTSGLNPITAQLCQAWSSLNKTDAAVTGPTPSAKGIAALIDAVAALEAAVVALQGG